MSKAKKYLFNNRHTGEVLALTKADGKALPDDWSRIKPAVNEKGEHVLRMQMEGGVIDISPTEVNRDGDNRAE